MTDNIEYTTLFLEAMERVKDAINISPEEHKSGVAVKVFVDEMMTLGWRERIKNLYRIKDKLSGDFLGFNPNKEQSLFLDERKGRDLILKSRQIGFTTLMCIYSYDRALWDGWTCGIMSHIRDRTEKIFQIIKNADEWFLKDWGHLFNPERESSNATTISFLQNKGSVGVSYDFQSLTLKFLHISEAAFIDTDRIENSLQSVPENGEVALESTANGRGGFFYEQWQGWKKSGSLSPYKGHFFSWYEHYPEDSDKWERLAKENTLTLTEREEELEQLYKLQPKHLSWRRWKVAESFNGDDERFEVHYPIDDVSCFLSGENRVFSSSLMKYQESFVKTPAFSGNFHVEEKKVVFRESKHGIWDIWERPNVNDTYVIGVDCSEGIGKDRGIISIWSRNTGNQVAELRAQLAPDLLADEAWKGGQFYRLAWICPEANNIGHTFINSLTRKSYSKVYKRQAIDEFTNRPTQKLGFLTTSSTKIPLTDNYAIACREGQVRVRSNDLINEMSTFVQIGGKTGRTLKREAIDGCHDDCIMAAALAYEMHRVLGKTHETDDRYEPKVKFDEDTGFAVQGTDDFTDKMTDQNMIWGD